MTKFNIRPEFIPRVPCVFDGKEFNKLVLMLFPDDMQHNLTTYQVYKCRCAKCRESARDYMRDLRSRKEAGEKQ